MCLVHQICTNVRLTSCAPGVAYMSLFWWSLSLVAPKFGFFLILQLWEDVAKALLLMAAPLACFDVVLLRLVSLQFMSHVSFTVHLWEDTGVAQLLVEACGGGISCGRWSFVVSASWIPVTYGTCECTV